MTDRERPNRRSKDSRQARSVCGKASEKTICDACADKIQAEALANKKREEKGA